MDNNEIKCDIGRRYLVWFTVGFVIGIFIWIYYPPIQSLYFSVIIPTGALLISLGTFVLLLKPQLFGLSKINIADRALVFLIILGLVLGFIRVSLSDFLVCKSLDKMKGAEFYTGYISDEPILSKSGKSNGFIITLQGMEKDGITEPVSEKVLIYCPVKASKDLKRGDFVSVKAEFEKLKGADIEGEFDSNRYYRGKGIIASQYTYKLYEIDSENTDYSLEYRLETIGIKIRETAKVSLNEYLKEYPKECELLQGILFGDKSGFTDQQNLDFSNSGFAHITSVSGMHISFLCGFLFWVMGRLRLKRWLMFLISIPFLIIFSAIAAFTPSVIRAVITMMMFMISYILVRENDPLTSLSFAGLILLIANPYMLFSYSFLLSFSAVAGILIFYDQIKGITYISSKKRIFKPINYSLQAMEVSLSATLGMGFFLMKFFGQLSWGGIIGNIFIIPLGSFCFTLGLVVSTVDLFAPDLARIISKYLLSNGLWCMNKLAEIFAKPVFIVQIPYLPDYLFLIYIVGCIGIYWLIRLINKKKIS